MKVSEDFATLKSRRVSECSWRSKVDERPFSHRWSATVSQLSSCNLSYSALLLWVFCVLRVSRIGGNASRTGIAPAPHTSFHYHQTRCVVLNDFIIVIASFSCRAVAQMDVWLEAVTETRRVALCRWVKDTCI
jgi:hypothetical protein